MLSAVIGLLAFGVTIPGFEAITDWKKAEFLFNSTKYNFSTENRHLYDSYTDQFINALKSYKLRNENRYGRIYGSRIPPSSSEIENITSDWNGFEPSMLFRPMYKSINRNCESNVYKVYSNNEKSAMYRNNYEVWSGTNYLLESTNHKIRRSELTDESSDDGSLQYDDDYSLMNYLEQSRVRNKVGDDGKQTVKRRMITNKSAKREAEGREFSVMFHPRKNHESKNKSSNNNDFIKNGKKKSRIHSEKKKHKHDPIIQHEKKMNFMERHNSLRESLSREPTSPNPTSPKKKYSFWSGKKEKAVAKVGNSERIGKLSTSSRSFSSSPFPPRKVLHWATTRDYVADISKRNLMTPIHLTTASVPPSGFFPLLNLSDPILIGRKSSAEISSPSPMSVDNAAVLVNESGSPQYLRLGNENLDIRNLNPNLPFPLSFNIPLAKQSEDVAAVYGPPVLATTPVVFSFNAPTEVINPFSNHLDAFKNITTWNAKQGPPGRRNSFSNLANLINYQIIDNGAYNLSDIPVEQALPVLGQQEKTRKSVDGDQFTSSNVETQLSQYFQNDPLTVGYQAGVDATPNPILGAEALVNFLQNALLNQSGALNDLPVSEGEIVPFTTTDTIQDLPIDNNLIRIFSKNDPMESTSTEAVTTDVAPLLQLFTTEEPLMSRFSDIINRNADRKIPIVYDIEEAPQLVPTSLKLNMTNLDRILHEMPPSRIRRRVMDRLTNMKKSKTSTTVVNKEVNQIEKQTNLTTPWFFLTTTENMLYSEMKEQYLLESMNKPTVKSKKINLLFKSKVKPTTLNGTATSVTSVMKQTGKTPKSVTSTATKPTGRTGKTLTSAVPKQTGKTAKTPSAPPKEKGRRRKAITDQQISQTKTVRIV